jgi:hypothetical protein
LSYIAGIAVIQESKTSSKNRCRSQKGPEKKGRIPDEAGQIKALKMHVMIQAMTTGKKAGRRAGT